MEKHFELDKYPFTNQNLFFSSDTSNIYKINDTLYKIYLKYDPYKNNAIDYLIKKREYLEEISIPPSNKIIVDNKLGIEMKYIPSIDFLNYINNNILNFDSIIEKIKILSDNLKIINRQHIHFSDLHHHNIIIDKNDYPIYIDLDDACCNGDGSNHICAMSHNLHELKNKSFELEDDLIKYGNLDCECLTLMLLDYILGYSIENKSYDEYHKIIDKISKYTNSNIINLFSNLKKIDDKDISFLYYVGDYLDNKTISELKILKKDLRRTKI